LPMSRRHICASCGQASVGVFCSVCGSPLEVPSIEMLSTGNSNSAGNDVEFNHGVSRSRSALLIAGVLGVLGIAAVASGRDVPKAARLTTVATTTSTPLATSTTSLPPPSFGSRTLRAPVLPGEQTSVKLLLLGLIDADGTGSANAVLDVDAGQLLLQARKAPYAFASGPTRVVAQTNDGILVADGQYATLSVWGFADSLRLLKGAPFGPQAVVIGDVYWSTVVDDSTVPQLVGYSLSAGERTVQVELPSTARLVGRDAMDRPVIVESSSGTYAYDAATKQFVRSSLNQNASVQGNSRIEHVCSGELQCNWFAVTADSSAAIPEDLQAYDGTASISPDGQHALVHRTTNGVTSSLVLSMATGALVLLGPDSSPFPSFSWSSDGRWLFGIVNGQAIAWREGLAAPVALTIDGRPVTAAAIGVFPAQI
jgi:hypothetical protein